MAGHEVRGADQIRSLDRNVTETEVGAGVSAGLLGVVVEIALGILRSMVTDDLDGVLVGANGTVGTETVELALGSARLHDGDFLLYREGLEAEVIHDSDGEAVLRLCGVEVVVNSDYLCRGGVLRGETVTAADDERCILRALEYGLDVLIERLSESARLFGAVEDGDLLHALRQHLEEVLGGERTVEAYDEGADLPALCGEVVDGLLYRLGHGTHCNDDILGLRVAVVVVRTVLAAGQLADFTHIAGNDVRNCVVGGVAGFAGLEIYVTVLGGAAGHRRVRIEGPAAECGKRLLADHTLEGFLVDELYLLDLV